jgi:hypothetical protein
MIKESEKLLAFCSFPWDYKNIVKQAAKASQKEISAVFAAYFFEKGLLFV